MGSNFYLIFLIYKTLKQCVWHRHIYVSNLHKNFISVEIGTKINKEPVVNHLQTKISIMCKSVNSSLLYLTYMLKTMTLNFTFMQLTIKKIKNHTVFNGA